MKVSKHTTLAFTLSMLLLSPAASAQERAIEMKADRVIIYPQRMALTGEETLLDVLRMYPDLMQSGFSSMGDGYNIRIDNSPVNLDPRIFLNQLKAKHISKIQVCDNTGVAKGTTGTNRVLDINMLRYEEGVHGIAGAQSGTDDMLACNAEARLGSKATDLYASASYSYKDQDQTIGHQQHLSAHMTNWLGPRDRLLTYFTQQYQNTCGYSSGKTRDTNEKCMARARYFHDFNDRGTELLIVANYQYTNTPHTVYLPNEKTVTERGNNYWMSLVELNTPIVKGLDMMLGWEGDFTYSHYKQQQEAEQKYNQNNNDIYLQLNYQTGPWRFTIGDRIMFYRYATGSMSHKDTRHNTEASIVASLSSHSQLQAAYHRKFSNPSFSIDHKMTEEEWLLRKGQLNASYINEFKLAYVYSRPCFSWSTNCYRLNMESGSDLWKLQTSAYFHTGILSATGGANLYKLQGASGDFATFHIDPSVSLPAGLNIGAQAIFATKANVLPNDKDVYTAIQLSKHLGKHWTISLDGHDLCSSHYAACLATMQYRF